MYQRWASFLFHIMKPIIRYFFLTFALGLCQFHTSAQKLNYTAKESEIIHDSINKSRWDNGGRLSQYSFRYMSEFFPVGIIYKSDQPYLFESKPTKSFDNIMVNSGKGNVSLESYLKELHIASFIVVHKGSIVYEKYFSMLPDDKHTLQSVTKVITSTIITSLINEKSIIVDEPIEKYIPELKDSDWQGISVRDILNMRSGIDVRSVDFETRPFTNPLHKNYQLESALGILPKAENTPTSVYSFLAGIKRDTIPGLQAAYSNLDTFVLGWLAENVTGKKYADLVSERLWRPMGASSNAYVCLSGTGIPWPHGGMSATLRDLARFGMLYTESEIRKRSEHLISFQQLKEIFDTQPVVISDTPFKWGYQWDLANDGVIMKGGFGGQALFIDPTNEIVVAYFNYVDEDWGMTMLSKAALSEVMKVASMAK